MFSLLVVIIIAKFTTITSGWLFWLWFFWLVKVVFYLVNHIET